MSWKRHALAVLVEAMIKEEMLERADVERIMLSLKELKIRMRRSTPDSLEMRK